jgi:uncharacterized membrane protein
MQVRSLLTRSALQDRSRAIVKTLLYRTVMVLITIAVALVVTDDLTAAVNIGLVTNVVKTLTYYCYERAWDHVSWGVTDTA